MPSSLSVRLGVIDKDYGEALESNARKFKVFGRELNQGALELGRSMGAAGQSLGKLGSGFQLAGTAAGLFAGADGLLGIGASLASGGLLLGGFAAISFALNKFEKDAEEAKSAAEEFAKSLDIVPKSREGLSQLDRVANSLRGGIFARQKEIADIQQQQLANPALGMNPAAGLADDLRIRKLSKEIELLETELDSVHSASDTVANALNSPEGVAAELNDRVQRTVQAMGELGKTGQPIGGLFSEIAALTEQINANLHATTDPMSKNAAIARQQAMALEDAANAVAKIQNAQAGTQAFRFEQKGYPGSIIGGVPFQSALAGITLDNLSDASKLHGNGINSLGLKDLDPKLFEPVRELVDGTNDVRLAIDAGFQELPGALAGVLGPIIAGAFGNSRGAQIGGALGSAFGAGVGGYAGKALGAGLGGAIGTAVFPVVGGLLGGVLGGAIGSLFGGSKKAVDASSEALSRLAATADKVNEAISNLPAGIKVAAYRYAAADPSHGNFNPITGVTRPPGAPGGGVGGGGSGGGIGLHPTASGAAVHADVINVYGVTDVPSFLRQLGAKALSTNGRGGATALRVAMTPGT